MSLFNPIIKQIKKVTAYIQSPSDSYKIHNVQYEQKDWLEQEKKIAIQYERDNVFNNEEYRMQDFLDMHPEVRKVAVDIGSGVGWLSSRLAKYFSHVISIEPSVKAIEIAKILYPPNKFSNIEWIKGFAEDILPTLKLKTPALFLTGVVLSHLRDKEVKLICQEVNRLAKPGSLLCFNECWGKEWHQNMWHVRTKEWWQEQLPDWDIIFDGPAIENVENRFKGMHGIKIA